MSTHLAVQFIDSPEPLTFDLDTEGGDFHDLPTSESTHLTVVQDGGALTTLIPLRYVRLIVVEATDEGSSRG